MALDCHEFASKFPPADYPMYSSTGASPAKMLTGFLESAWRHVSKTAELIINLLAW